MVKRKSKGLQGALESLSKTDRAKFSLAPLFGREVEKVKRRKRKSIL